MKLFLCRGVVIQHPKIPNAPNIGSQPPKILPSVSMGPRGDVVDSTKRPLSSLRMDPKATTSSDKDIKQKEEEENSKTQNNFSHVAPGTP